MPTTSYSIDKPLAALERKVIFLCQSAKRTGAGLQRNQLLKELVEGEELGSNGLLSW